MENVLIQIKDAITMTIKRISPDVDVFYEEVKKTEKGQGLEIPKTYYFVDIIPAGNNTVDRFFSDMRVLIDIAYHEERESNVAYLVRAAELDAAFRPIFAFGNRKITIDSSSSKVTDHVLHFTFPISFRQAWEQTEEFEKMGELDVSISKGE